MNTAFCGNWFPREESIDNKEKITRKVRDFREIA
jgi:hypothetical protein